jgi:hypothetical protein
MSTIPGAHAQKHENRSFPTQSNGKNIRETGIYINTPKALPQSNRRSASSLPEKTLKKSAQVLNLGLPGADT